MGGGLGPGDGGTGLWTTNPRFVAARLAVQGVKWKGKIFKRDVIEIMWSKELCPDTMEPGLGLKSSTTVVDVPIGVTLHVNGEASGTPIDQRTPISSIL